MGHLTIEYGGELWQAVLAKGRELVSAVTDRRGDSRSTALYSADGRSVAAIFSIGMPDGTNTVYCVTAWWPEYRDPGIRVDVDGPWIDSCDKHWARELADRPGRVVIGGEHYRVVPDLPDGRRDGAGYGGRLFRIRLLPGAAPVEVRRRDRSDDRTIAPGEVFETRNLWHQGTIPPKWRERLPDTAEFVREEPAGPVFRYLKSATGEARPS
jgi:hypothetical protein